jgi:dUTP pyrophosphatase
MYTLHTLQILAQNEEVKQYYLSRANHASDSGVDLYVPETTTIAGNAVGFVSMQIKCRMLDQHGEETGYFLFPRSSISKTPLMLANSIGLIDASYRGDIIAALRNMDASSYDIEKGTRLVQIVAPSLSKIKVELVESLNETERGSGGFGSTG